MNKSAHILVVDDEPDTIEILSRQLNAENYKVLKACSGKESLELLKKHKPDLILMDIMMPEMDGFETIKIIRDTVKSFIPIIIVTASKDDTESITRGFAVGANDYVVIPCHKEELLARIKAMLRIKELHDALEKRNRKLAEAYDRIKQTITERKRIEGVIRERVKELSCLYAIADLIEKEDSLEKILQGSADLMPNSWFYPEIACARITLGEQKYTTANFRETVWKQSTDINMHGKPVGVVEICYLEERPDKDEGPFLKEERNLLHVIAEWLGKVVERKWAEEALRESEERFRLAVNATKDGIWEWDIQTNQEFFSPRWCEIIGYSFDDPELPHTYTSWESRIHPDDYDRVISAMKNHLEKGTRYDVDYRHRHKSGEYRWQNSKGQAVLDESGKPIKMIGCIEDISERKQAEEALKFKNIMLATQQEVSIDGILVVDEQGKMISFNRRFADIWGIPDDILASQSDEKALKFVLAKLAEPEEFLKRVVYLYEHKQEKSRE